MNVTGIVFTNDASLGELTIKRTMASLPCLLYTSDAADD